MEVKERIGKLLALAKSPNENEAKAALLKARALMAQHKLRPEECTKGEPAKVKRELVDIACSKTKYTWAIPLSFIIARHYCCESYRNHRGGERVYQIGFVGLEDDFEICKRIFLYAFDCCKTKCDDLLKAGKDRYTLQYRRAKAEAYGRGFCQGLQTSFDKQTEENQEWGLVMVVPQAVTDAMSDMHKKVFKVAQRDFDTRQYARMGYADGMNFDPSKRIPGKENSNELKDLRDVQ